MPTAAEIKIELLLWIKLYLTNVVSKKRKKGQAQKSVYYMILFIYF